MTTTPRKSINGLILMALLGAAALGNTSIASDFDKPVFEFQSKLATQGNAKAQYYLAQMYEEGRGTEANPELAKHWYEQAKLNGYKHDEAAVAN